jgi:hypothetical protein
VSAPNITVRLPESQPQGKGLPRFAVSLGVSALLLMIIWEWLRPLPELAAVTELYRIGPFVSAFALGLLLDGLQLKPKWSIPLKAIIVIALVGRLFYPQQFAGIGWIAELASQVRDDVSLIAAGQYDQIGGATRTLLFAAGWMMMASVLHALLLQRQQTLWLGGMTLLYLLVMQLVFGIDTVDGVLRTVIWTGLLTSLLLPGKLERKFGVAAPGGRAAVWTLAAAAIVAACVAAALFGWRPQQDQRLMKPLDYGALENWAAELGWTGGGSAATASASGTAVLSALPAKTGYSSDDSALGGPVIPDSGIVFEAKTSELTYWRGESKSTYDGKGWSQPVSRLETYSPPTGETPDAAVSVEQEIMLQPGAATRLLFLGGALSRTDALITAQDRMLNDSMLRYDSATGAYSLPELSDPVTYYKVVTVSARPSRSELESDNGAYPQGVTDTYLQLPASLPQRVRDLAARITADAPTPYAKAAAVSQYLKENYAYSYDKAAVPGKQDDFVDRFLFVDKTGYCDYFSTSMAVMLRTVGVPTRWVKGYAPGVEQPSAEGGGASPLHQVAVRNQDAHSWVEVYFPKSGWVAFDPTPGFGGAGTADIPAGDGQAAAKPASVVEATIGSSPSPAQPTLIQKLSLDPIPAGSGSTGAADTVLLALRKTLKPAAGFITDHLVAIAAAIVSAAVLILLLHRYRRRLTLAMLALRARRPSAAEPQASALVYMDLLWARLYRQYGRKAPHETIREYCARLQLPDESRQAALREFAKLYELARYDTSRRLPVARRTLFTLWKRITEPN